MLDERDLTPRQRDVLHFVAETWWDGRCPTVRDIMEDLEIKSPNGALGHLKALRRKGYLADSNGYAGVQLSFRYLAKVKRRFCTR